MIDLQFRGERLDQLSHSPLAIDTPTGVLGHADTEEDGRVLTFSNDRPGSDLGRLDLARLYPNATERARFEANWPRFLNSDTMLSTVVWRTGADELYFRTEALLPSAVDDRPPVLLVVGNPAPHSVISGLPFSYEGDFREHRFWITLRDTGYLTFHSDAQTFDTWEARNEARRNDFHALRYDSPFRLGLVVYFSMSSP